MPEALPPGTPAKSRKESGALRTNIDLGGRPGAALLLCGALVIIPLLLIHGDPLASAPVAGSVRHHLADPAPPHRSPPRWKLASSTQSIPATGTTVGTPSPTSVPPVPTTTPTPAQAAAVGEEVARQVVAPTTVSPPTTTTTTAPSGSVGPGSVHYGEVTYYDHPAGTCASPWLAFGTVVEVINPANGYAASCVVNDREADTARSIDLATATFAELAPLSQGVINAELRW